jgi:hypothetical protein
MSQILAKAIAAVVAAAFVASAAAPAYAQGGFQRTEDDPVYFDLGIDVRTLPQDSRGAKAWLAMQPALTRQVIVATCDNYIKRPVAAEMPETLTFCRALMEGGTPAVR